MAVAMVASPVVGMLINSLGSAGWAELGAKFGGILGVKEDIQRLQGLLSTINAVLEDAEMRAVNDGALRKWLKDLRDVAFDASDVLDEFQTGALYKRKKRKVRRFFSSSNTLLFRSKMACKIKRIIRRFDEIAEERLKFHLVERATVLRHPDRETFSSVIEHEIVGRKHDKENVVEWLVKVDNDRDVSVLPIVGLGGLGKTTLAKLVFNDEKIKRHFEIRMWVCVGEDFDVKSIAQGMLVNVMKEPCTFSSLEDIHHLIHEKITNKRYLLILDDVWSENTSKWERLRELLGGSTQGNKVIVTTCSHRVAEIMGAIDSAYKLKGLRDDDCWKLFKQRAFGPRSIEESSKLAGIGKEIVQRCGGLPLAAKSLGSLMATKKEEHEWLAVRDSELWKVEEGFKTILPALQVSYDHLSPQLKQCFGYCSVFPKDCEIEKFRLIQLWIAQGFIHSKKGMLAEDVGNMHFETLLCRSFFQDEEKDDFGNIVSCKMHDLVHDLACFVAKDESSIVGIDEKISLPFGCRYSSILCFEGSSSTIVEVACEAKKLRSFSLLLASNCKYSHNYTNKDHPKLAMVISNLTRLRALHLDCISERNIIDVLGNLKYLRFLELSCIKVVKLPESITGLCNLQTLNLRKCRNLKELPKGIKMMSNLRHLDIGYCLSLIGMPREFGQLNSLQTLSLFQVGGERSHGTIAELKHLNQIRGGLTIRGLEDVKHPKDSRDAEINSKSGLQSLTLKWDSMREAPASSVDILENLQPHPNLKHLKIEGYGGNRLPSWLTVQFSSLPNLVQLSLRDLPACESLPSFGSLPSLNHLLLWDMGALKKIGREFYGESTEAIAFPSLKNMSLFSASNLEEWLVPVRNAFPSLESLKIYYCPKLAMQGRMPSSLVDLRIWDSNEEILASDGCLHGLTNLRKLSIYRMEASKTSWKGLQHLSGLQLLEIRMCFALVCLPEGLIQCHFSSLKTLELFNLYNLESLGEGGGQLDDQPPPVFMSLQHLSVESCPRLTRLPEWLRGLTSLQSLQLSRCPGLAMLPDGLQCLTGLAELNIHYCPILKRRCERETGDDWYKIAHIPDVRIKGSSG